MVLTFQPSIILGCISVCERSKGVSAMYDEDGVFMGEDPILGDNMKIKIIAGILYIGFVSALLVVSIYHIFG